MKEHLILTLGTHYVRISIVTQNTRTDWLVIRDAAFCVWSAGARILAYSVHARLV